MRTAPMFVHAHDMTAQATFAYQFPNGLALSRRRRHGHHLPAHRIHPIETLHAVMLGHLPRGDGGPQHGRQLRFQRGQIPTRPTLDKMCNSWEIRLVEEGVDEFPIGGIPTDEEQAFQGGYVAWVLGRPRRRNIVVEPNASNDSSAPLGSGIAATPCARVNPPDVFEIATDLT